MTISNDKLLLSQKEAQLRQRIINLTLGQAELFIQVSALRAELESIAQKHPNKTNGSDFNTAIHELLTLADQCIHPSLILTNSKIFFAEDDVTTTQCNTVTLSNLIDQITNKIVVLDIPEFTEIKNILNKILAYYTQYSQQVLAAKLGEDSKSLKKLMESKAVLINEEGDCYEIPMKIAYEILGIDRHGNSAATRELGTHRVARLKTKDGDIHCKSSSISDIKPAAEKAAYFLAKALGFNILSPIESVFLVGLRFQRPQKLGSSSLIENFDQAYTTLVQMSFTIDGINIEHLLNAYNTYQTIDLACRNFSYDRQKNLYSFKIIFDSIRSNQYFNNYITTEAASIANIITADAEYVARAVLKGMATIDPQNRPKDFNDLNKSYVKQIENINDIISKRPRTENSNSINEIILKGVAFVATWPELTQGKEFVEVISLVNELEQAANLFKKFSTDEFILFMNNFYSRFDKVSYSQHSIFDIIIGTSDAKPSNHMAEVIPSNRSWAATGIDNDEFTEQTVAIDREGTHVNCFRSFFPHCHSEKKPLSLQV
ncbi:MAG: hypothetical protein HWD59_06020 [Coxiellaceae bacterium]|nr:MAG: hypothetical protein HWD59_06020 [Coxiellaceae bacterium]